MFRHRQIWFAIVPMLLLVLIGCSGSNGESPQDTQSYDTEATDIIDCPDGMVLWEEYGVCAPHIPECEAWEMPTVDGECVVVGPRACPKTWDPDADVDCEPGDLLPCKEGFVLTEDEVACIPHFDDDCGENEIPVLGGGCKKVGPQWGEEGEPYFDECGEGFLALPGGGCVMVGPRACPKLWDPDADVDCEIGDVLPCPEGWLESNDGLYCEPIYDDCPHGERSLLGGGCERVIPLPEECPPGPFPEVPEGAVDVVYVLADSLCTDSCGSMEAPYPSIQNAVDAVPVGGYVLVGEGTYEEGLFIDKSVHVTGVCTPDVVVAGKTLVAGGARSQVLEAAVGVLDTDGVVISGLRVVSPVAGMAVVNAKDFSFTALDIDGSHGVALYIDQGSEGEVHGTWLRDSETGTGQFGDGMGLWVGGGSDVAFQESVVESVEKTGITVEDEGTELTLEDSAVRSTRFNFYGDGGHGVRVQAGAGVSIIRCVLEDNRTAGLQATAAGDVFITGSVIRNTNPDADGNWGYGIQVDDGSIMVVADSLIAENNTIGLNAFYTGTEVRMVGTIIRGTKPKLNGNAGFGGEVGFGAALAASGCLILDNTNAGMVVHHEGAHLEMNGTVVRDTKPVSSGEFGFGIQASDGCSVAVSESVLEGNSSLGVFAPHSGTAVIIQKSVIRSTLPGQGGEFGFGIQAYEGASATISGSLLENNTTSGVVGQGTGTTVAVAETVVRDTIINANDGTGTGIQADFGADLAVSTSLVQGCTGGGVNIANLGTQAVVDGTIIRDTKPDSNGTGYGIQAKDGSSMVVSDSLIEGNTGGGVVVTQTGTQAMVDGTVVRDTQPVPSGNSSGAVYVQDGSELIVSGCLLEGNKSIGVFATDSGTSASIEDTVVRDTKPDEAGEACAGILTGHGAQLVVSTCLIQGNAFTGISGVTPDTIVQIERTVVRDTQLDDIWGLGVGAGKGCTLSVSGSLIEENPMNGVMASNPGTDVSIQGSIIRNTKPVQIGDEKKYGEGIFIGEGVVGAITMSLVDFNTTEGIFVSGPDAFVSLLKTAVIHTLKGGAWIGEEPLLEFQVFGDGVYVEEGAVLEASSVLLSDNERCGLYYNEASGSIEGSVVALNLAYGLAMEQSEPNVNHQGQENQINGNAIALPPGQSTDITPNPQGLPTPPAPEIDLF